MKHSDQAMMIHILHKIHAKIIIHRFKITKQKKRFITLHVNIIGSWYSDWQMGQIFSRNSLVDADGKGRVWNASFNDRRNCVIDLYRL